MYDYKNVEYQKVVDILLEFNKLEDSKEKILDFYMNKNFQSSDTFKYKRQYHGVHSIKTQTI